MYPIMKTITQYQIHHATGYLYTCTTRASAEQWVRNFTDIGYTDVRIQEVIL